MSVDAFVHYRKLVEAVLCNLVPDLFLVESREDIASADDLSGCCVLYECSCCLRTDDAGDDLSVNALELVLSGNDVGNPFPCTAVRCLVETCVGTFLLVRILVEPD